MSTQNTANTASEKKGGRRPTRRQFAIARRLSEKSGADIPEHAQYSRRAMSGFIGAQLARTAS